jgi:energy-coupling factor transport system permease protein
MAQSMLAYRGEETFFQTRIHPLTKMIIFFTVVFLTGIWLDVRYLLPFLIIGLVLAFAAKVPKRWFLVMLTAIGLTWWPTLRSTVAQANAAYYQVLDPAWAATPIATLDIPFLGLGTVGLTYGSTYWMLGRVTRFATVVTWALLFVGTTPMSDITNTLYALKVPQPVVFVLQMTYKFIPYMSSVLNQIMDAQKLRGWNLRTINLVKLFKRSVPLANPLIRRTAVIVEQVTIATQIRGFGSGKVTPLIDLDLPRVDRIVIAFFLLFFVIALLASFIFKIGQL